MSDAAPNLRYRTILMTLYSTGMRHSELGHLRPRCCIVWDRELGRIRLRGTSCSKRFVAGIG